jgi:hypothetical protein
MSSGGTQSPPLEATGEHKPMGVSSIGGGPVDAVPDIEQRSGKCSGANQSILPSDNVTFTAYFKDTVRFYCSIFYDDC